jgi:hypothetical protein
MIPGSVTNVGPGTFEGCTGLTNVTIACSMTNLGDASFFECSNLASVYIRGNAPTADASVFSYATNATVYYLPGTIGWSEFSANTGRPTVLWNPDIEASGASFGLSSNQFGFNITGTTNIPIAVEGCTNLDNPVWTRLQAFTLTNGLVYFNESVQTNISGRFYRISAP